MERPPFQTLRAMFYAVTPNETSYSTWEEVPNFVDEAVPYFMLFIFLECVVLKLQGKDLPRVNDGMNSISHGLLSTLHSLMFRPVELVIYAYIYTNWRLVELPWDSPWVWFVAFLLTDFLYYWFHRISHESNIVWASHQVHHSSEDYNLTTALRQSAMQKYYSMFIYFLMALAVPTPIFYVHQQFNLLYQFWIHTECINTVGPLEYVLNTPSHHRVHHGRNPYCIDKNYAGTLIIWDRMFNTFQAEGDKVIYGLVHPNQFWSPLYGQACHYLYILGLIKEHKGLENKLSAVVKGPGWGPGKPWTGLPEEVPEVKEPVYKYDKDLPLWANAYVILHFALVIVASSLIAPHKKELAFITGLGIVLFFVYSLTVFGALFDHRKYSSVMEFVRCVTFLLVAHHTRGSAMMLTFSLAGSVQIIFLLSAILWGVLTVLQYNVHMITKKVN
ncbi:alkylglycerol monooxygenase [Plakobranchus ocellatus]|uniref:Alkylglycerol monooxygenase n=1 Tax=Plakobranchus ocellatus TaxID=259542 RepID=A0AAV4D602_9GAST|nr:alkylglycerol monooxygenase [Plakobranchus ocellatus]